MTVNEKNDLLCVRGKEKKGERIGHESFKKDEKIVYEKGKI